MFNTAITTLTLVQVRSKCALSFIYCFVKIYKYNKPSKHVSYEQWKNGNYGVFVIRTVC